MYNDHYGLTANPFQLTPDARFWFESATHRKAMAYLGYGLAQGEGFIVITGEIGAGKTTLVGHLLESIDPARLFAVRLASTQVETGDLLRLIAHGFGVASEGLEKAQLLGRIESALKERARTGQQSLIIVDEAQNLSAAALEELRLLSNFQGVDRALLQILLLGQPEFRHVFDAPDFEQLRQRVIATHHLMPMEADEVGPYIAHRLKCVGWTGRPDFADDALRLIHKESAGIPRKINTLVSRALMMGTVTNSDIIDEQMVAAVVADMANDRVLQSPPTQPAATVAPENRVFADQATLLDVSARVTMLEAQVAEQDAALRRVLTLLIDWAEGDSDRPNLKMPDA